MRINNLGTASTGALIADGQSQKEIRSNELDNLLSNATQKILALTISDAAGSPTEADRTLTDDEFFGSLYFRLSGSPTVPFNLTVPASGNHVFIVENNSGEIVTVTAGGTTVAVSDGVLRILHSDGTDIRSTGGSGSAYDIGFYIDSIVDEALLAQAVVVRSFTIPAGATGSQGRATFVGTSGDDDLVLSLQKNGSEFGTLTFANLDANGVFSVASSTAFVANDLLQIFAPDFGSPQEDTIGHSAVSITFKVDI